MSLLRISFAACAVLTLASCGGIGGGRADAANPTVAELDRLDTQWGLTQRKSRGAPKRTFQYSEPTPTYNSPVTPATSTPIPPRETVNTPPPATPTPQLDPGTINKLR